MNIDLSSLIKKNDKIAVGLSGGADSMALLNYLISIKNKYECEILAINVEHGIRGENSLNDTEFVKNYCSKNNIECKTYKVKSLEKAKNEGLSVEQSARILRYECFYNAIKDGFCDKVATAHHKSDNAETVLFNLFRGSGLKGLTGIDEENNRIIRPFINVSKKEIEEYISSNNIPFINDETNFCSEYTRNFIRLKISPLIKEIFPEYENAISRFSSIAKEEDIFMDTLAKKHLVLSEKLVKISLPIEKPILSRAVIIALKYLGIKKDYEKLHSDLIYELTFKNNGDKLNLPKNIVAIKEYDFITLYKDNENATFNYIHFGTGEFNFTKGVLKIYSPLRINLGDGNFYIDKDKIPENAVIRTRKTGDIFRNFSGKSKKLKDYFIDKKVPSRLRDYIPVVATENIVLFIAGIEISDLLKIDKDTINVLKLEYNSF